MAIKLTKNEQKVQKDRLKQYQRYLPTLQLKKQQLQSVIMKTKAELDEKEVERAQMIGDLDDWVAVFAENEIFDEEKKLDHLVQPETVICKNENIAGVTVPAFQELKDCLQMTTYIMNEIKVNEHILDDDKYLFIFSVEEVNRLAREGMPFRDAYKKVGLDIEAGKFTHDKQVHHTHEGSIGNLCNDEISALMQQVVDGFNFCGMEQAEKALLGR